MCILQTDRQVDSKTKEALTDWVRDFLWHFEGACTGDGQEKWPNNPEEIIINTILGAIDQDENDVEGSQYKHVDHLPSPASFFLIG